MTQKKTVLIGCSSEYNVLAEKSMTYLNRPNKKRDGLVIDLKRTHAGCLLY